MSKNDSNDEKIEKIQDTLSVGVMLLIMGWWFAMGMLFGIIIALLGVGIVGIP